MQHVIRASRAAALAALILAVAAATGLARPAGATVVGTCVPGSSWGTVRSDFASQVVDLVNQHRQARGLQPLVVSASLGRSAVWKARHMAAYSYMEHADRNYPSAGVSRSVGDRLDTCGYPVSSSWYGENIAYGYTTPQAVMNGWLNSAGHRANIEKPEYRSTGVGVAVSGSGTFYWAQNFGSYTGDAGTTPPPPPPPPPPSSAPTVTVTSKPASTTSSTTATFAWTTTGSPTSTTCRLDAGVAASCTSPKAYYGLAYGTHTFRVTVANPSGSSTATVTWTVGSGTTTGAAPTVTLTSKPSSPTTSRTASFAWTTTGSPTRTLCSLDAGVWVTCASPRSYTGLAAGAHTFRVYVSNAYGGRTVSYGWQVT